MRQILNQSPLRRSPRKQIEPRRLQQPSPLKQKQSLTHGQSKRKHVESRRLVQPSPLSQQQSLSHPSLRTGLDHQKSSGDSDMEEELPQLQTRKQAQSQSKRSSGYPMSTESKHETILCSLKFAKITSFYNHSLGISDTVILIYVCSSSILVLKK